MRGLLRLARGGEPVLERVEPGAVARAATELVEHRFSKAGVALSSHVAPDLPSIACEPRLFEQVLVNLLANALDAAQGQGEVGISWRVSPRGGELSVWDTGAGFEGDPARLFAPWYTTKKRGTGLGLAISRTIIAAHEGTLDYEPNQPAGARFSVRLAPQRQDPT